MTVEYVVQPLRNLDGRYLDSQVWTQELDDEAIDRGVICQAFEDDYEVGKLAIDDGDGKVLIVEVESEHQAWARSTGASRPTAER